MAIRAFLSFVEEDLNLVNLFRGQARNERFDLNFADFPIQQPFNSRNAESEHLGRKIADQIKLSALTICLCGPTTHTSHWVNWELRKSLELGKPLMGVLLYSDGRIKDYPPALENWPRLRWDIRQIVRTMDDLARQYRK